MHDYIKANNALFCSNFISWVQPEPEFRPPMSEVVQALVRLVQRTNMSKRTQGGTPRAGDVPDTQDF